MEVTFEQTMAALREIAITRIRSAYDEDTGLFSHKTLVGDSAARELGLNPLYSAICLIGLLSDAADDDANREMIGPRTTEAIADAAMLADSAICLQGAALWSLALAGDHRCGMLASRLAQGDLGAASSMDLGLALAGLSVAYESVAEIRDDLRPTAEAVAEQLRGRFVPGSGLFRSVRKGKLRARVTSFASQVYPILGLSLHGLHVTGTVCDEARASAERIVAAQGSRGQWWWWYSAESGEVVEGYPVYSVHQDAMGPMALLALKKACGADLESAVAAGLDWIDGGNELGVSLVDPERALVRRCIQRVGSQADGPSGMSRWGRTRGILGGLGLPLPQAGELPSDRLETLDESRSYHYGWILYTHSLLS